MALTNISNVHQLPSIGERLVTAGNGLHGLQYEVITLAGALDASDEWLLEANSAAHWIADALDMCLSTAREWVRIGKTLRTLPELDQAFATHTLSYSKVRAVSRVATPNNETDLIDIARRTAANRLGVELATYLRGTEPDSERRKRQDRSRSLKFWTDADGMVHGHFRLPPLMAAIVLAMLDAIIMRRPHPVKRTTTKRARNAPADASDDETVDDETGDEWPSLGQQRADALVTLAEGNSNGDTGSITAEVIVHVRGDGCTLDDGTPISQSDVERIAPTSFIRVLVHDANNKPVNASGRQRHPTSRQKRVVKERDRQCLDCGSTDLLEYDHVPDYRTTRHTLIEELEVRCAPCHHRRHRNEG